MNLKRASTIRRQSSILIDSKNDNNNDDTNTDVGGKLHNTDVNQMRRKCEWENNRKSAEYIELFSLFS